MGEKLQNIVPNLCVKLDQYRLIDIAGHDAEKYLQGQLTCDVTKLAVGTQTLTAHCDPKGKMSALFRLYRQQDQQFVAIIRNDLLPDALTQLKKYAVFSKVTFTELDYPLYGTTSDEIAAVYCEKATACHLGGAPARTLFWGDITVETNGNSQWWDLIDIQQGIPLLFKANQFELIPQAVNLHCLDQAISFTKGCYIGQETIARAKYRGANKRAMFTLVGEMPSEKMLPKVADSLELQIGENWKATGIVLASVWHDQRLWVQIVLNKETELESLFRFGEVVLRPVGLPYVLSDNL